MSLTVITTMWHGSITMGRMYSSHARVQSVLKMVIEASSRVPWGRVRTSSWDLATLSLSAPVHMELGEPWDATKRLEHSLWNNMPLLQGVECDKSKDTL